jgi:uncharacterized membrane protein
MSRVRRILTHLWFDEHDARRMLGHKALASLTEQVRQSEQVHDGEIRLCIEAGLPLPLLWRGVTARQRAHQIFGELRVWNTEHNNGVLVYLLLAEHAIEIVADRGLRLPLAEQRWPEIIQATQSAFERGEFERGLGYAVSAVTQVLQETFPATEAGRAINELPDTPDVR